MIDVSYRSGCFDAGFRPVPKVSEEILRLLDLFDPIARLSPHQLCLLSPTFMASARVGGADADIVIDDRLIDLKTTAEASVTLENLLQLAGYAALHQMGGIALGDSVYQSPFVSVELYFARYGVLVRRRIEEFFPGAGFDHFCDSFRTEIEAVGRSAEKDVPPSEERSSITGASILNVIAQHLRELPEAEITPVNERGKHRTARDMPHIIIDQKSAAELKKNKNNMARCRTLAKKFGCMLIANRNGPLIFLKLPEGSAARGNPKPKALPRGRRAKAKKRG